MADLIPLLLLSVVLGADFGLDCLNFCQTPQCWFAGLFVCSVFPFWDLQVGTHGVFILKEEGVELKLSKDLSVYFFCGISSAKISNTAHAG